MVIKELVRASVAFHQVTYFRTVLAPLQLYEIDWKG